MLKRGLSPLIATVLLIGATIALAALVLVWGQGLFEQTIEETGKTAQTQIVCTSRVQVELDNVNCDYSTSAGALTFAEFTVDNKNEEPIEGFIVRVFDINGDVEVVDVSDPSQYLDLPLGQFERETYDILPGIFTTVDIDGIEVLPKIALDDGSIITCSEKIEKFGDIDGISICNIVP